MSNSELVLTSTQNWTEDPEQKKCYSFTCDKAVGIEEGRTLIQSVIATHNSPVKISFNKQPPYLAEVAYFDDEIHYYKFDSHQKLRQVLVEGYSI